MLYPSSATTLKPVVSSIPPMNSARSFNATPLNITGGVILPVLLFSPAYPSVAGIAFRSSIVKDFVSFSPTISKIGAATSVGAFVATTGASVTSATGDGSTWAPPEQAANVNASAIKSAPLRIKRRYSFIKFSLCLRGRMCARYFRCYGEDWLLLQRSIRFESLIVFVRYAANAKHNECAEQSTDHPKEKVAGKWIHHAKAERADRPAGN